jgi:hypothetical protein
MGRTVPTFTNLIDAELASWSKFRRGLRKDDQENFYAMRAVPFESMMMSIVMEQQKAIRRLEEAVKQLSH